MQALTCNGGITICVKYTIGKYGYGENMTLWTRYTYQTTADNTAQLDPTEALMQVGACGTLGIAGSLAGCAPVRQSRQKSQKASESPASIGLINASQNLGVELPVAAKAVAVICALQNCWQYGVYRWPRPSPKVADVIGAWEKSAGN